MAYKINPTTGNLDYYESASGAGGGATIGNAVSGGTAYSLLRVDASGNLADILTDAATAAASLWGVIGHNSSGTPADGFGSDLRFQLQSSTTTGRNAAGIVSSWATAADATRKGALDFYVYGTGTNPSVAGLRVEAGGSNTLGDGPKATVTINGQIEQSTWGAAGDVDTALTIWKFTADSANPHIRIRTVGGGYNIPIFLDGSSVLNVNAEIVSPFGISSPASGYGTKGNVSSQYAGVQAGGYLGFTVWQIGLAAGFRMGANQTNGAPYYDGATMLLEPFSTTLTALTVRGLVSQTANLQEWQDSSNNVLMSFSKAGLFARYNNIATAAWGVPAIYGSGRSTAQTGAVTSVAAYTVGASDGSFLISSNINVTAYTAGTVSVQCDYTDETNTARTFTFTFSNLTGTLASAIGATGPYEGFPVHIRCKASTAITIKTTLTVFTGTYNVEGIISQIT